VIREKKYWQVSRCLGGGGRADASTAENEEKKMKDRRRGRNGWYCI